MAEWSNAPDLSSGSFGSKSSNLFIGSLKQYFKYFYIKIFKVTQSNNHLNTILFFFQNFLILFI